MDISKRLLSHLLPLVNYFSKPVFLPHACKTKSCGTSFAHVKEAICVNKLMPMMC